MVYFNARTTRKRKEVMKFYGLFSKKQNCLMSFDLVGNAAEGEFCGSVEVSLSAYFSDNLWVTPKKEVAENIAKAGPTEWYNAGYNTPNWSKEYYGLLKVVNLNEWE